MDNHQNLVKTGDQTAVIPQNQEINDAISAVEQLLMSDENYFDPLLDTFVDGIIQEPFDNIAENHFPESFFEENNIHNNQNGNFNDFPRNYSFGNPIQIPVWPVSPSPHSCTCCQTLREFFHINGTRVLKLDVHGRLGLISHALLERFNTDMPSQNHEYYMFDFSRESISNVKQFLVQYCDDRKREGYIMLQDPLSNFYNALFVGLDGEGNLDANISLQQPSTSRGGFMNQNGILNQQDDGNAVRLQKSHTASQRERTGKMKLRDLKGYFHLPLKRASKEMNLCSSAIKSICRKEGLLRWPHRKIKSIENKISKKQKILSANDPNERERALTELRELQQKLANYYEGNFD